MILTPSDIDLIESWWVNKSRESFYHYRQFINYPKFKKGWFPEDLALKLQQFYNDMVAGLRPVLIIQAPPQHGKSSAIVDFIAWFMGHAANTRVIYGTFSERLGIRANRALQRIFDNRKNQLIFPEFHIGKDRIATVHNKLLRNNTIIETSEEGFFRNTTVGGSVTGESLDLAVIDDPIKGRKAANSKTTRNTAWDWLTDDFMTRFSEYAGLLVITTRWHVDDPAGRLTDKDNDIKCLNYEAINNKNQPLFPEHKSLDFLLKRKAKMLPANWLSLYQGAPVVDGGNIVKSEWWRWGVDYPKFKYKFITADTAQKKNTWNDFTVFQCWGVCYEGNMHLIDQFRDRVESPDLRKSAIDFYNKHNTTRGVALRSMYIEDKSSGIGLIQEMKKKKFKITAVPRDTDKITRAQDAGPEIKSGKIILYKDVKDVDVITDEAAAFPNGVNDDAFDCCMTAIEITYLQGFTHDYGDLV